jgi:hypothetical protein
VIGLDAQGQLRDAGIYDAPGRPGMARQRLMFEWLHPREAALLRERGEPYPRQRTDGTFL